MWETEAERLALLAEVIAEQNGIASYKPPQAPEIHNPPNWRRQLNEPPYWRRKSYRSIRVDDNGQIQPAKPSKPKPAVKPAEPEDKRPRGEHKPLAPSALSLAIARYLARPKGTPAEAPVNRPPVNRPEIAPSQAPRRQPTATHRTKESKPRPMDVQDLKALEWLRQKEFR